MQKLMVGDNVVVTAGRFKGQTGKVMKISPKAGRGLWLNVEGLTNKKHRKANPQQQQPGQILDIPAAIHRSNVMLMNPATKKGDKVGIKTLEDGKRVRFFKSNGEVVDAK